MARASYTRLATRSRRRRVRALDAQSQDRTARRPGQPGRLVSFQPRGPFSARIPGTRSPTSPGSYGPAPDGTAEDERLREYERGFRRAGLPLFIAERSAATDIFNRAVPLIGFVFLAEVLRRAQPRVVASGQRRGGGGGARGDLPGWHRRRSTARGDGPRSPFPRTSGKSELAAFVIVPAILPLIFGGQWLSAVVTAAGNLVLLGLDLCRRRAGPRLDPALDAGPPRRPACAHRSSSSRARSRS